MIVVRRPETVICLLLWLVSSSGWAPLVRPLNNRALSSFGGDFEKEIVSGESSSSLVDAAAAVTLATCKLIGVKSLGVDYGLVRTGLAITSGYQPSPLLIVEETDSLALADEVVRYAASNQVNQVVLGLPLNKNGTEAEQTTLTRMFALELKEALVCKFGAKVPLLFQDERYTSKEAKARAHAQVPGQQLYGMLDAEAACIILETFYESNGEEAEFVLLSDEDQTACLAMYEKEKLREEEALKSVLKQRESKVETRQAMMERARRQEDEMREKGALGESNKKKRKKKKKLKRSTTKWTDIKQ